jgi:hypothetical protein
VQQQCRALIRKGYFERQGYNLSAFGWLIDIVGVRGVSLVFFFAEVIKT